MPMMCARRELQSQAQTQRRKAQEGRKEQQHSGAQVCISPFPPHTPKVKVHNFLHSHIVLRKVKQAVMADISTRDSDCRCT